MQKSPSYKKKDINAAAKRTSTVASLIASREILTEILISMNLTSSQIQNFKKHIPIKIGQDHDFSG